MQAEADVRSASWEHTRVHRMGVAARLREAGISGMDLGRLLPDLEEISRPRISEGGEEQLLGRLAGIRYGEEPGELRFFLRDLSGPHRASEPLPLGLRIRVAVQDQAHILDELGDAAGASPDTTGPEPGNKPGDGTASVPFAQAPRRSSASSPAGGAGRAAVGAGAP